MLIRAMEERGIEPFPFTFRDIVARVGYGIEVEAKGIDLKSLDSLLVRPIGRGSLDEIIFRMDLLRSIESLGIPVINPPEAIERAVDKYMALFTLSKSGIPVPRTFVTESPRRALNGFDELGRIVIKPLFGSRGMGITRLDDREVARRIFNDLAYMHHTLYLQEFKRIGRYDIRAFVIGDDVVAAMKRISSGWRKNVSLGARAVAYRPDSEARELAIRSTKALGCVIAGVDLMKTREGYVVNEVNSQPGFRALQGATSIDIAGMMVEFMISRARR